MSDKKISARLDEERAKKLDYLQNLMGAGISQVVKLSIDAYYRQVAGGGQQCLEVLRSTGFLGCGEASPDWSSDHKKELREIMEKKA